MKKLLLPLLFIPVMISTELLADNDDITSLAKLQQMHTLEAGFVGLLTDQSAGKTYLKVNNIGEEFIYQTSLPNGVGSNDIGLDRGQLGDTRLVVFEKAGNKLFLKQKTTNYRAITENPLESAAIEEAFASSILWGFEIIDSGPNWVLVDASDFILQDIHGVARTLESSKQGEGYEVDPSRSALDRFSSKAFPDNTELQATITLVGEAPGKFLADTVPNPYVVTVKMRHSFVRLPEDGYRARAYLPKSGYWSIQYQDYAQPINSPITQRFIGRHRLIKRNPLATQSEVVEPIIYYIDPGVPEPIRSALIDGARWWASAFEELGFRDAYRIEMLPEGADPMDVRFNVIQWVHRSTRGWSYGSSVSDPRTGEIIKGHVTLGSLRVRQDYLIAQGMMAPFDETENDQALMDLALARIRQLSAHEVGHTLGLLHNFAASNYGRASVMDYPHPKFELNGTKITAPNAYGVGVGSWDKAAIAYGYTQFADQTGQPLSPQAELLELKKILAETDKQGLLYINDQDARSPASAHANASLWDNGEDAVTELERVMKIRAVAMDNFGPANLKSGQPWSELEEIFVPVYYSHRYQTEAAAKWLAGLMYDYSSKGEKATSTDLSIKQTVSGAQQQRAIDTLLATLQPQFLSIPEKVANLMVPKAAEFSRTRESVSGDTGNTFDRVALAAMSAQHTLSLMLHPERLARLQQQSASHAGIPSVYELTHQINAEIVNAEYQGLNAHIHQAVMDLVYSNYLNLLHDIKTPAQVKAPILAALENEKRLLASKLKRAGKNSSYLPVYRYQLERLSSLIMDSKYKAIELPKMPPGSPI